MAQVSKKFNPVEREQILTELIKKEEKQSRLSEVFSVPDPRRMALLPAKPNATTPADRPTAAQLAEAEGTLSRLAGIKHTHQVGGLCALSAAFPCLTPCAFAKDSAFPLGAVRERGRSALLATAEWKKGVAVHRLS